MSGKYSMRYRTKFLLFIIMCSAQSLKAQRDSLLVFDPIQVLARPGIDSVVLRWAPMETRYWLAGNKHGYIIERYTMVRDGQTLSSPERKVLTETPVKPYPEALWESVVANNKFATIAAQALLGESFNVNMKQGGVITIVNKAKENDQRFSIALFCADMSVTAAKALGLYYTDRTVKKNERYLYRFVVAGAGSQTIKGSVFVEPDAPYLLPVPMDFSVQTDEKLVSLRWDKSYHKRIYTAYIVEKSEDGTNFKNVFGDPVTTLSPEPVDAKFEHVSDTLQEFGKEYHYRIKGLSPFGEEGPASEVIKITGKRKITDIPHITSAHSPDNKTIELTWEFPAQFNSEIQGFNIERAPAPSGKFNQVNKDIVPKEARIFTDPSPEYTNYYRIIALVADKKQIRSMDYFIHLIDSVPPGPPSGMSGVIDDHGNVTLSWNGNSERDIYGYRVYRAYNEMEEFAQLTSGPVREAKYNDKVVLKTLDEKVHYRVMAIDINQNHSDLSQVLSLTLPDKVRPVSPVFLPVRSSADGIDLTWMRSSSTDVVKYDLYRNGDNKQWLRVTSIPANSDTLYHYRDTNLKNGEARNYTLVAIDEAGLESEPTAPVNGSRIRRTVWPSVTLETPQIDRTVNKVLLKWSYDLEEIKMYQVYKSVNEEPLTLYRSVSGKEFADQLRAGSRYHYSVVAVFADGSRSEMGKGVSITY
jgi:hypothetical protein